MIKPGTVETHTISHLDWLPTFASLAGAEVPEGAALRGHDITPLLKGTASDWNDDFYAEHPTKHQSHTRMRMYRTPTIVIHRQRGREWRGLGRVGFCRAIHAVLPC